MIKLLGLLVLLYIGACIFMYLAQDRFVYFPDKEDLSPARFHMDAEKIRITTADNTTISAWYMRGKPDYPVILYLHGNAGHLGHRLNIFRAMHERGFSVLALSWRGFGDSDGHPSQEGLYADAKAGRRWLIEQQAIAPNAIIYYGESLGTGVATWLAAHEPPLMLMLEAPYTSVLERGQERFWWLPVAALLRDTFPSRTYIARVDAPILILHGDDDTIIPLHHGQAMLEAANNPKHLEIVADAGHNRFDRTGVAELMAIKLHAWRPQWALDIIDAPTSPDARE